MATKSVNKRARNWTAVVYPDSAPEDWQSILDAMQVPWACSPLHDSDVDDDGVIKKAHWHIILCFGGNKSYEQIKEITDQINAPIPQVCRDMRSSVRYFIHLDHPHKFQYNASDITSHCGFDAMQYLEQSTTEKRESLKEILLYCQENHIFEYADLIDALLADGHDDWFIVATERSTLPISCYLKSSRYRSQVASLKSAPPNSDTTPSPSV